MSNEPDNNNNPNALVLNGHLLHVWQSGRRKYAIERRYRYRRWHPTSLFSTVMRRAVFQLSQGITVAEATSAAVGSFLAAAKSPGLDVASGTNTYALAMDLCATVRTILEYVSRLTLLTLRDRKAVTLPNGIPWSFLAHEDESGVLHRWRFVDSISDDGIIKEMHSWELFGDLAAARAPMTLHLVAIGQTRNSRRYSPWCRAYKSPTIANMIKFQRRSGNPLQGDWKPIWFADNADNNAADWVDLMQDDNAIEHLIQHINIKEPDERHIRNFYRDVAYEHDQILTSGVESSRFDPMTLPMCRSSCDVPYVCPHQFVCYSTDVTLDNSGLYERIAHKKQTAKEATHGTDRVVSAV